MRFCVLASEKFMDMASMCVATIRHHHPGATIVHMTHEREAKIPGADEVWRRPLPVVEEGLRQHGDEFWTKEESKIFCRERIRFFAQAGTEPTALLDADVLVCKPLDDLWERDFDVALVPRHVPAAPRYNDGVMYSRKGAFYDRVLERVDKHWLKFSGMLGQHLIAEEAASGQWKVLELPGDWNCSEINAQKAGGPGTRVLHYKGARKQYMKAHFERGVWK